jgi:hypothetical protein
MRFRYVGRDSWPELAWLARLRPGDPVIEVHRGRRVEVTDEWFGEIAWAGRYEEGRFDATDVVAGSGGLLRHDDAYFVSPGSTVDRLQCLSTDSATFVSNSLVCLLSATGASPCEPAGGFAGFFRNMLSGLAIKNRELKTSAGPVRLMYFHNLRWDGRTLAEAEKPFIARDFTTFPAYKAFLDESMESFAANAGSPARRYPWRLLAALSSGYDSPTVAAIARQVGLGEVVLFDHDRKETRDFYQPYQDRTMASAEDSGKDIAAALGLRPLSVARDAWMDSHLPEVPFLAADAYGLDVFLRGAEDHLAGTVLLTGFFGGRVWAKDTPDDDGNLTRRDQSGLSLTEYRLTAGFLHAPMPYWGARQIGDLVRLSNSRELEPWDVPGGYSRPICRRIVEDSGVPRNAFGTVKRAASVMLLDSLTFLSDSSLGDYRTWLENHPEVFGDSRLNRWLGRQWWLDHALWAALPYDSLIRHTSPDGHSSSLAWRAAWRMRNQGYEIVNRIPTRHWVFPWATERAGEVYTLAPSTAS